MTRQEIMSSIETATREASRPMEGERVDKQTLEKLHKLIQDAAYKAYENVPMVYRDKFNMMPPVVRSVLFEDGRIVVKWKTESGYYSF